MRRRRSDPEPVAVRETALFQAVAQALQEARTEIERLSALLARHRIKDDVQLDRLNELHRGEL